MNPRASPPRLLAAALAAALGACHTAPSADHPVSDQAAHVVSTSPASVSPPASPASPAPDASEPPAVAPSGDLHPTDSARLQPCLPDQSSPKASSRPKRKTSNPAPVPPRAAESVPAVATGEAQVRRAELPLTSILGKKVHGRSGEDLGRVVDLLSDTHGRVRLAIVEFGGFLGVGNRRIAVDWSLLKFQAKDEDVNVILDVSQKALQDAPEYKETTRPLSLMAPVAAAHDPAAADARR